MYSECTYDEELRLFIVRHTNRNLTTVFNEITHLDHKKFSSKQYAEYNYKKMNIDLKLAKDIMSKIEMI